MLSYLNFMKILEKTQDPGTKVSIYLRKSSNKNEAETQLNDSISAIRSLNKEKSHSFLKALLPHKETILFKLEESSIAIFITQDSIYYTFTDYDDEPFVVSAETFHIKPLIKDQQRISTYYILSISGKAVKLFKNTKQEQLLVDITTFKEHEVKLAKNKKAKALQLQLEAVQNVLKKYVYGNQYPLILAGASSTLKLIKQKLGYSHTLEEEILCNPEKEDIRSIFLKGDSIMNTNQDLIETELIKEIQFCKKSNDSLTNLEDIIKAAIEGRVNKLVIAEDIKLWGEIDMKTGQIQRNDIQESDEDDDLLDDLSELVYMKNGSVLTVPQDKLGGEKLFATLRW